MEETAYMEGGISKQELIAASIYSLHQAQSSSPTPPPWEHNAPSRVLGTSSTVRWISAVAFGCVAYSSAALPAEPCKRGAAARTPRSPRRDCSYLLFPLAVCMPPLLLLVLLLCPRLSWTSTRCTLCELPTGHLRTGRLREKRHVPVNARRFALRRRNEAPPLMICRPRGGEAIGGFSRSD